jgi:pimeloyl-ACP methyl ester carboxylesterase
MAWFQGPDAYVRQARAMQRRKDQQTTLRKITQPTVVMCGDEDRSLPVQRHEFLAGMIPDAKLAVIVGAGHLPTLEQPDFTTEHLRSWMKQPLVLR